MRTLFQSYTHRPAKRTLVISMSVHGLVLGALILLPLISYAALPQSRLIAFVTPPMPQVAPAPPKPPAPSRPPSSKPQANLIEDWDLPMVKPIEVPNGIEEPPSVICTLKSQPEGISGLHGAIGIQGVPLGLQGTALPEPPRPKPVRSAPPAQQLRVSEGIVLSKAVRKVHPRYPPLAKRARVSGTVRLDITIDELGNVIEIEVMGGPSLLIQSAKDAVSQWKFSPTRLNDQPVKVKASISVVFRLD